MTAVPTLSELSVFDVALQGAATLTFFGIFQDIWQLYLKLPHVDTLLNENYMCLKFITDCKHHPEQQ